MEKPGRGVSDNEDLSTADSPFKRGGQESVTLCDDNFNQGYAAGMTHMGQYLLRGTGQRVTCALRTYTTANARTGNIPANRIVQPCGPRFDFVKTRVEAQLWCGGYDIFWNDLHTFSQDECKATNDWTCGPNVNTVPKYGGVSVPAAGIGVMHDGLKRAATWLVPSPKGIPAGSMGVPTHKTVTLDVDPKSTPYRKDVDVNGESNRSIPRRN